jgi:uncharacterized membrane protein
MLRAFAPNPTEKELPVPREFINPNLHVILIHYPLGLLTIGLLIEIFAIFGWRRSAFRAAGRWMILIGALSLGPSLATGLYAMADTNRPPASPGMTWAEVRQNSPIQGEAWEMMREHAWYNAGASAIILFAVVMWLGSSDLWRSRMHLIYLLLLIAGMGGLVIGAWHGGEMVYRFGVGVERQTAASAEPGNAPKSPAVVGETDVKHGIAYFVPPDQTHVILAGAAVSLALVAIGLSLRAGAQARLTVEPTPELSDINSALNPNLRPATPYDPVPSATTAAQLNALDDATVKIDVKRVPTARFWILAALVGLLTAATGWWTLAYYSDEYKLDKLWESVANKDAAGGYRRLAHSITGVSIVVLMLILAVVSRMRSGRRFIFSLFTLLLLLAVASQVWLGSLLLFDTNQGPVLEFNSGSAAITPSSPTSTEPSSTTAPATPRETTPRETTPPESTTRPATTTAPGEAAAAAAAAAALP